MSDGDVHVIESVSFLVAKTPTESSPKKRERRAG